MSVEIKSYPQFGILETRNRTAAASDYPPSAIYASNLVFCREPAEAQFYIIKNRWNHTDNAVVVNESTMKKLITKTIANARRALQPMPKRRKFDTFTYKGLAEVRKLASRPPLRIGGQEVLTQFTEQPELHAVIRTLDERWAAPAMVDDEEGRHTAALMVHAYNLLPSLVSALEKAQERLLERASMCEENGSDKMAEIIRNEIQTIDDVLALAQSVEVPQ